MKDQWLNFRPLCLIFAFLLLGTIFSFYVASNTLITVLVSILVLSVLIFICIKNKSAKFIIISALAFAVGAGAYFMATLQFAPKETALPSVVEARIYNVGVPQDGTLTLYADSIKFDENKQNFNLIIRLYDTTNDFSAFEIGDILSLNPSKIYATDLFFYKTPNAKYYADNLKYSIIVSAGDVNEIGHDKTFAEQIRLKIKENLHNGLSNENVEIAYSALFGDKTMLSPDQYNAYKMSGIAHMLAVSGLHVGIIVGLLSKLFKLLKVKPKISFIIICLMLIFYMYVCNFAVSVVRATIMSVLLLLAPIVKRRYDSLSALGIAGIICFAINPLLAFDVSALMSFSCIAGIVLLYKSISLALAKVKFPNALAKSLALSASTSIAMLVIMAFFFNNLNIISLIANIILIPIFTVAFSITFVLALFSLVLPFITYLLYPIGFVYDFLNLVAVVLGNLPIANFSTISFNYIAIVVYFLFLLLISRICTASETNKVVYTLPLLAIFFVCLL